MKARKNPSEKQLMRRLRRAPESVFDPRYKNDGYWVLRSKGYSHAYAKRVHREKLPKITVSPPASGGDYPCDPEEILFDGPVEKIEVEVRPPLSKDAVETAEPRDSEYTIWDETVSGFGLRVRTSGHKSYVLLYRVRGTRKLKRITLGRIHDLEFEAARRLAREFKYIALKGIDPAYRFQQLRRLEKGMPS